MKLLQKFIFLIVVFFFETNGFASDITLDNATSYPQKNQNSKIAVQWANSAKELEEANQALASGTKLNPNTFQFLNQSGKIKLSVPKKAEYFRVLAWSKENSEPDFNTNWVEIIPSKTYRLEDDQLVPSVLMSGMGC